VDGGGTCTLWRLLKKEGVVLRDICLGICVYFSKGFICGSRRSTLGSIEVFLQRRRTPTGGGAREFGR
jgi:hypothetical protein